MYLTPISSVNLPKDETILSKHTKSLPRAKASRLQHNIWIFSFQTKNAKNQFHKCLHWETRHIENESFSYKENLFETQSYILYHPFLLLLSQPIDLIDD
jgi:hypothetical protein